MAPAIHHHRGRARPQPRPGTRRRRSARLTYAARRRRASADLVDVLPLDGSYNSWELAEWEAVASDRKAQPKEKGTLKWWASTIKLVQEYLNRPAYETPDLPNIRKDLRSDLDKAIDDPESITRRFADQLND